MRNNTVQVTKMLGLVDIEAEVVGSGPSAQAGAIRFLLFLFFFIIGALLLTSFPQICIINGPKIICGQGYNR